MATASELYDGSIEIDPDFHRLDSGLSDDSDAYLSSTQSLASSINEHVFENGQCSRRGAVQKRAG
jgi:hypothetical protein